MSYTITFNQDFGDRLQSRKDSSVINIPSGACIDLAGCGGQTHYKGGYNFNANIREDCEPPNTALQYAGSGYVALNNTATFAALSGYQGVVAGVNINILLPDILQFAISLQGQPGSAYTNQVMADLLGISDANVITTQVLGKNIEVQVIRPGSNRTIAQVQRVSSSPLFDSCRNMIGSKAKTSISILGFDPDECIPTLLFEHSMGLAYNTASAVLNYPADLTQVVTDITDNDAFRASNIFAQTNTQGSSTCETVGENMESQYLTRFNVPISIGNGAVP